MAMTPLDIVVMGLALDDFGFIANNTVSGIGLNTFGFLWGCSEIWEPSDDAALTTTWVPASVSVLNTETCVDDEGGLFA